MKTPTYSPARRHFIQHLSTALAWAGCAPLLGVGCSRKTEWQWTTAAPLPFKLQEIYAAVLNDRIHIAGGFIEQFGGFGVSDHHIAYDPHQNIWETRAPLPQARHHPQLVAAGEMLYVLGGYEATGMEASWIMHPSTWAYDPMRDSWEEKTPAPQPHGETVGAALGGNIHLVGGRQIAGQINKNYSDHQDTDIHWWYDPRADRWDRCAPALSKRNSAAAAVIDNQWYVVGGRNMALENQNSLEIYDPKEDRWRHGMPMPQGQGGLAAAAIGGKLYAFGGEYFSPQDGVFEACWCYHPETDRWTAAPSMKTPRHGLAGATVNNRVYAIGGAKKANAEETSEVVEYLSEIRLD